MTEQEQQLELPGLEQPQPPPLEMCGERWLLTGSPWLITDEEVNERER